MTIDGHEIVVQPSSFQNAMALKKAVADALRKDGIEFDMDQVEINDDNILESKVGSKNVGSIAENLLSVGTDPKLQEVLFRCCEKVVLFGVDKDPVNEAFFQEVERWPYYYPIMIEVLKVNLLPFFGKISSLLSGAEGLIGKLRK